MDQQHPVPAHVPPAPTAPPTGATGTTAFTDAAVAKVAAAAARSVAGVHSLGVGGSRALGALRGAVGAGPEPAHGVTAEVGTQEVAVDLVLTAEFGRPLHLVADDVRAAVFDAVGRLTGLRVIEVNIEIGDVHLPAPAAAPHLAPDGQGAAVPPAQQPSAAPGEGAAR
ncbi:Asp23/Gls24 family envelope stress response protein [Zafaria sp. Z1313]|uniref:Asp23/Gls24 family envelope stress response protein n=1 Tax=unclassified Zafaria TaxID=2828765 RepID=UPI002E763F59|nr:Asp23/Gls24 family envelope stress response protein [Zafaria sp. J156]MEE1621840.1 Asp23/Gls24 family envelope stress response protein [Zafaria sp. J156]